MNVLLSSPLGALLAKPWLDPVGLFGAERLLELPGFIDSPTR